MTNPNLTNISRFPGLPKLRVVADETRPPPEHRFTPDTLAEYRDLVMGFHGLTKFLMYAQAMKEKFDKMPERFRNELIGTLPGFDPLELGNVTEKLSELSKEIEAGLDEWERYS